jgi:hypothetical protein
MGEQGSLGLESEVLGALPVVNHFFGRLGLDEALGRHVPSNDRRLSLDPAVVLGVVVRNLVLSHRPLYSMGEWAASFSPAELGLSAGAPRCSTTTGWEGLWRAFSTPTGRAC